jgi:hypothetical protein
MALNPIPCHPLNFKVCPAQGSPFCLRISSPRTSGSASTILSLLQPLKVCLDNTSLLRISSARIAWFLKHLAIILFHYSRSLVQAISCVDFLPCHFVTLPSIFFRCLLLSLLPFMSPVVTIFSNFPFPKMCPYIVTLIINCTLCL